MTFITSGVWVWAVIFVLSALKLLKDYSKRNDNHSGGGEDLSFLGSIFWTFVSIFACPISAILLIIALVAK